MARRIRRDLSNKKVRKIIHEQLRESQQTAEKPSRSSFSIFAFFRPVLYFAIFALTIFIIYQIVDSVDLNQLFSSSSGETSVQPAESSASPSSVPPQPVVNPVQQKMQVEILNGCGVSGIAMKATEYLRQEEVDVVYMGNYSRFDVSQSQVLDRVGNLDNARKIARILGISSERVKTELSASKQLEATVILGKDYRELKPYQK